VTKNRNGADGGFDRVLAVLCGDLNMLRCFTGSGVRTCVVTDDPDQPTLYSRYLEDQWIIASPRHEPERAVTDLETLGASYTERPVLYYGDDAMLLLVSRHRERLESYFRFLMPPAADIEALTDKSRFGDLARERDLPVPRTFSSRELGSPEVALTHLALPCILKPSSHVGWFAAQVAGGEGRPKKALRVDTPDQLRAAWERLAEFTDDFVLQQYIGGGGERIYSFHTYYDAEHRPLGWFCGHKIRTYPKHAGVSTYLELVDDPRVARLGREVADTLGLVGPAKLDFKEDDDGRLYLLEVNARCTLWNHLGAAAGVNLPLLAHRYLARGERPATPVCDYEVGLKWLNFGNDARAVMRDYRPRGDLSLLDWLRSYRGRKVYDLFAWDDPVPAVVSYSRYLRALRRRLGASLSARLPG
jgi:D-aspartate ligase